MLEHNLVRQGENLAFETDLLYLDVNNNRLGIGSDTPFRTLLINQDLITTNLIVDSQTTIGSLEFDNNTISNPSGEILLSATGVGANIYAREIQLDGLSISNNIISSLRSNEDIDIFVPASKEVRFNGDVEINGSLHATGNVTFDGSIIFGNDDTDSVTFNSKIASDIIPDLTDTYNLGSPGKKWSSIFTNLVNGQNYITGGSVVAGVDLSTRQGNIWYVASNGNDSNVGDHPNGPFSTIEHALSQATSGDTVYIYPGTYVELFPLTVPVGVTVKGAGIRDVKIVPDTASQYEDVFKLNGETTIEDLTIADFYYDSGLDKGYAFSFAPGFTVTSRSPYIRNISVITKGSTSLALIDGEYSYSIASVLLNGGAASTTSFSQIINGGAALFSTSGDPLGFNSGDAGRGALIDGSVVNSSSQEASMLFHSATFITPGVDCIVMKNGVRVEWLNSFIYYANRGLYAEDGAAGFASLGIDFGAELRSIGSANVYGNYGAWADGSSTTLYLITHNFSYIGAGKDTSNDPTLVIEANQTTELNNGKIYYQSVDQRGNFNVGDVFTVDSATGNIVFQSALVSGTNITVTNGVDTSYIDAFEVSTGNITISGNTIESNSGGLEFKAANTQITVTSDILANQNLSVAGNLYANKNVTLGNIFADTLTVNAKISSNISPVSTNYDLGSAFNSFRNLYASQLVQDNIQIDTNFIRTTVSNSDLELAANGSGVVRIADSLNLYQNLSVLGSANLLNATANTLTLGSTVSILSFSSSEYNNGDILIRDNFITTTQSNSNLELRSNGTGGILFDNVLKINNSTIENIISVGSESDKSIIFAPYAGRSVTINSNTALRIPVGNNTNRTLSTAGEIRFNNSNNLFEGRVASTNLSLYGIYDSDTNTSITAELTPGANDNTIRMTISGTVKTTITEQAVTFDTLRVDELELNNNIVRTFNSNADIELDTSGTGILNIKNNFYLDTNSITNAITNAATLIQSTSNGYIKFADKTALLIPAGLTSEQPAGLPIGATRWNTTETYLEVFDGSTWTIATGGGATITAENMEDLGNEWALIFG